MHRFKFLQIILVLTLGVIVYVWNGVDSRNINNQILQQDIEKEYSGIVKKKYTYRGARIIIDGLKGEVELNGVSDSLYDNAEIGDTIIKVKKSDRCSLLKGVKIECDCYYHE
jgi:hypothetical protein